jgi:hypothetical protein
MQSFVSRIAPTFADAESVLLAGSSAGGYGAGLNFNQVQDAFYKLGSARVTVVMDAAVIYADEYLDPCLQRQWRDLWGLDGAMPSPADCPECYPESRGGLLELIFFAGRKYPAAHLGVITSTHDSIMRAFLAPGENACAAPAPISLTAERYEEALNDLRIRVKTSDVGDGFSSYFIEAGNEPRSNSPYDLVHQWLPYERFYEKLAASTTPATWLTRLIAGQPNSVGP